MTRRTLALIASLAAASQAQEMLGINNLAELNFGAGGDTLIRFDFANPAGWSDIATIRDPAGNPLNGFGGLDFGGHPANPTLYAMKSFDFSDDPNHPDIGNLYAINPATAQATLLGNVGATINDLAWDPVTQDLYGVDGSGGLWANLDDPANATFVGIFDGDAGTGINAGLGFDSLGNLYVLDLVSNAIYAGRGTAVSLLHQLNYDANFSQGLFVDWSRDDAGFHAALNNSTFNSDNFNFGTLPTGGGYGPFAGRFPINPDLNFPEVQVGDLARAPLPAPSSLAALALAALGATRRRRV